jgi:phospholipase C
MKCLATIVVAFVCLAGRPLNAQPPHFQHVIVVVQENRTPDTFFQGLCSAPYGNSQSCSTSPGPNQYNILTSNWRDASVARGYTQPGPVSLTAPYDLDHSHQAFRQMCDNMFALNTPCRMDGATRVACQGTCPNKPQFRYVDNSTGALDPYLDIATQYGFANYMFQTNQGPSFPAHLYLFGGTSAPTAADDANGIFAAENTTPGGVPTGCIADISVSVYLIVPPGNENTQIYPCLDFQTLGDFPQAFSWKYYTPSAPAIWTAPTAIQHICQSSGYNGQCLGDQWTDNVDLHPADVFTDISGCNLAGVSWVIPSAENSDHAGYNAPGGPAWVASIVNAVGASNQCDGGAGYWNDTAILIVWDDWGGWYDHEPPSLQQQPQNDYEYGFRVPLLVVSAYTPPAYIDNGRYDFGSIIRFIEQNFGLQEGILNFADARATTDLTPFFSSAQAPRTFKHINSPKDATYFINDKTPARDPDDD